MIDGHHMIDGRMIDTGASDAPRVRSQRAPDDRCAGHECGVPRGVVAIPDDAALVLVGFQQALEDDSRECRSGRASRAAIGRANGRASGRNNPGAERAAARLLAEWRATGRPVVHVRDVSTSGAVPLFADTSAPFSQLLQPEQGETVYRKRRGSAFIGTTLAKDLVARHVRTIVVAGLTTDLAIAPTVRSASDLGFTALVVSDAMATFERDAPDGTRFPAELMHRTALASLHADVAIVLSSAHVLEGLARAAV